jgi:hypothetical protein
MNCSQSQSGEKKPLSNGLDVKSNFSFANWIALRCIDRIVAVRAARERRRVNGTREQC